MNNLLNIVIVIVIVVFLYVIINKRENETEPKIDNSDLYTDEDYTYLDDIFENIKQD